VKLNRGGTRTPASVQRVDPTHIHGRLGSVHLNGFHIPTLRDAKMQVLGEDRRNCERRRERRIRWWLERAVPRSTAGWQQLVASTFAGADLYRAGHDPAAPLGAQDETTDDRVSITKDRREGVMTSLGSRLVCGAAVPPIASHLLGIEAAE
jgi:hypothetical protein